MTDTPESEPIPQFIAVGTFIKKSCLLIPRFRRTSPHIVEFCQRIKLTIARGQDFRSKGVLVSKMLHKTNLKFTDSLRKLIFLKPYFRNLSTRKPCASCAARH